MSKLIFRASLCLIAFPVFFHHSGAAFHSDSVRVISSSWYLVQREPSLGHYPGMSGCYVPRESESVGRNGDRCASEPFETGLLTFQLKREPTLAQFVYEVKVQNTTTRVVEAIGWQYDFVDPSTGKLQQRHAFTTALSLRPGQTMTLSEISLRPPTSVIDVRELGAGGEKRLREIVRVVAVEYAK